MTDKTIVRAFDGSLADARGVLAVDRATFEEVPYTAAQVSDLLTGGAQRAWVAVGEGEVVGFVAAFATHGLGGACWEIDLLAVHPAWAGRGLGTRLIRAAAAQGATLARQARAVIATNNPASARAFARAGFWPAERCDLLIGRCDEGLSAGPWPAPDVTVRTVTTSAEAAPWLAHFQLAAAERPEPEVLCLLLAEQAGQPAGCAELVEVQTLLYRGVWIESLAAASSPARAALIREAANRVIVAGLDEIGAMVPRQDRPLQVALLSAGFRSLGDFDWFRARLPLPGRAELAGMGAGHA